MAHHVSEMAYVGEIPWHGLGNVLEPGADIDTWRVAAGLDWEAIHNPMAFISPQGEFVEVPNRIVLTRSDNGHVLGQFTSGYHAAQPRQILEFFNEFVLADDSFSLETAGVLKGGAIIWALARYQNNVEIMGEAHSQYVFLTTSYDGSLATTAQATITRVVCNNTLTASLYDKNAATVKIRHNTAFNEIKREYAADQLIRVSESFDRYKKLAERLALVKMSRRDTENLISQVMAGTTNRSDMSTRIRNQVDAMLVSLQTTLDEGTEKNSAWTLVNATTRYVDHEKPVYGDASQAAASRMFASAFGSGVSFKRRIFSAINDYAGENILQAA